MKEALVCGPFVLGSGAARLLSQTATGASPTFDIGSLLGNIGIVGVLVWYLWYHTTHTHPAMLAKFGDEAERLRTAFLREQNDARAAFVQEQQEARAAFIREQTDYRAHSEKQTDELRKMLMANMTAMRSAVHDVRDVAHTAVVKAAAASVEAERNKPPGGRG
jgi:hypothetical protein